MFIGLCLGMGLLLAVKVGLEKVFHFGHLLVHYIRVVLLKLLHHCIFVQLLLGLSGFSFFIDGLDWGCHIWR